MKRKGFTLVELLVVIAIIGLLATLAFVSLNSARAKARDAKRVSDVRQIQSAMELFYNNQTSPHYPNDGVATVSSTDSGGTTNLAALLPDAGNIPTAPQVGESGTPGCSVAEDEYTYYGLTTPGGTHDYDCSADSDTCTFYLLTYCLGGATGGIAAGVNTATESTVSTSL